MQIPKHVAIVPDGNRRFAKKTKKMSSEGHRAGADVFKNLLSWTKELGIREISFWGLSTENLKRDGIELDFLFKLFEELCDEILKKDSAARKDEVRVTFCGARHLLPSTLQKKFKQVEDETKMFTRFRLNLLIAYGGREEILQAVRKIASEVKKGILDPDKITEKTISDHLYLDSDPDLIIRTGHACLSGLLPWQGTYAEIIFLDKFWPEFTKEDLLSCVEEFSNRRRSFGK